MATGRAWVLNLDADLELGARGPYTPTNAVREAIANQVVSLAESLLLPGDIVVDDRSASGSAAGRSGRAFCPTPRAIRLLERAGAIPEPHPSVDVLREVNGRGFSAGLGQGLPGAVFVRDLAEALAVLGRPPPIARAWRVKRAFGMAGRGQRVIAPGPVSVADAAFLGSRIDDGLQIEPNVTILRELGIHGVLGTEGELTLGRVVEQRCDAHGQWIATEIADVVAPQTAARLIAEAALVGEALADGRYFGPFGIDAFTYAADDGSAGFCPRSEINARYSMGFAAGFAAE